MRHILLFGFLILLGLPSLRAQSLHTASLDTFFNRLVRSNKAMGSVLISKNGETLYQRGFGQADLGKQPNTPKTIFRIGSITKTFTATLIFQLIEEGKLSLSDHLSKWYPQVRNADKISIDDLLTHHSGLHNFTQDDDYVQWQNQPRTKAEIIARIAALPSDFKPGTKAEYSNSNFTLLGFIIEDLTKASYDENVRQRITGPLQLTHTYFSKSIRPDKGEALPYVVEDGAWVPDTPSNTQIVGGAGGLASTVGDLSNFMDALFLHHLLSDASLSKMKEMRGSFGRGLVRFPFNGKWAYGHTGHIDNFSSVAAFFPEDSVVVSMVCNGVNYNFNDILIGLLSICYNKPFSIPDFEKHIVLDAAALKQLEGVYTNAQTDMDITISAKDNGLMVQAAGQEAVLLEAVSKSEFANDRVGISLHFDDHRNQAASRCILSQGGARIPFSRKLR